MAGTYEGKSDRSLLFFVLLMEGSNRFIFNNVNLYRARINLRNSLNLDVISPDSIHPFLLDILINILANIVLKERFLVFHVIHADFSNFFMKFLSPIQLIRDRPE